jgi:hypothetical protein
MLDEWIQKHILYYLTKIKRFCIINFNVIMNRFYDDKNYSCFCYFRSSNSNKFDSKFSRKADLRKFKISDFQFRLFPRSFLGRRFEFVARGHPEGKVGPEIRVRLRKVQNDSLRPRQYGIKERVNFQKLFCN